LYFSKEQEALDGLHLKPVQGRSSFTMKYVVGFFLICCVTSLSAAELHLKELKLNLAAGLNIDSGKFADDFISQPPAVRAGISFHFLNALPNLGTGLNALYYRKKSDTAADNGLSRSGLQAFLHQWAFTQSFYYRFGIADSLRLYVRAGYGHTWANITVANESGTSISEWTNEYWLVPRTGIDLAWLAADDIELTAGYTFQIDQEDTPNYVHFLTAGISYEL
jgi:hypothetical protein